MTAYTYCWRSHSPRPVSYTHLFVYSYKIMRLKVIFSEFNIKVSGNSMKKILKLLFVIAMFSICFLLKNVVMWEAMYTNNCLLYTSWIYACDKTNLLLQFFRTLFYI